MNHPENPPYAEEMFRLFLQFPDYSYDDIELGFDFFTAVGLTEDTSLAFLEAFCLWGLAKDVPLINPFYPFAEEPGAIQVGYKTMLEMADGSLRGKSFRIQVQGTTLKISLVVPPEDFNYQSQPAGSIFQVQSEEGAEFRTLLKGTGSQTFELGPERYTTPPSLFPFTVMRSLCGYYFPVNAPISQYSLPLSLHAMLKEAEVEW